MPRTKIKQKIFFRSESAVEDVAASLSSDKISRQFKTDHISWPHLMCFVLLAWIPENYKGSHKMFEAVLFKLILIFRWERRCLSSVFFTYVNFKKSLLLCSFTVEITDTDTELFQLGHIRSFIHNDTDVTSSVIFVRNWSDNISIILF